MKCFPDSRKASSDALSDSNSYPDSCSITPPLVFGDNYRGETGGKYPQGYTSTPVSLVEPSSDGSLLGCKAISSHLEALNFPQKSINSILRCGLPTSQYLKVCDCGVKLVTSKHKCNSRLCLSCSVRRKSSLKHKFLPVLSNLATSNMYSFYFLTISPENYSDLKQGLKEIRINFNKFLRLKYIKDRVIAGLYVIESKKSGDFWNVHLHVIVYGRRLDNQIRGLCLDCKQNLIKYDYNSKFYYCSNKFCHSKNVVFYSDSKVVDCWKKSSKQNVNIHITNKYFDKYNNKWFFTKNSPKFCINYMLKYVSASKENFKTPEDMAVYMVCSQKTRLISTFGLLYSFKFPKVKYVCSCCGKNIDFIADRQVVFNYIDVMASVVPPNFDCIKSHKEVLKMFRRETRNIFKDCPKCNQKMVMYPNRYHCPICNRIEYFCELPHKRKVTFLDDKQKTLS
jgi:hypothetical protein